MECPCVYVYTLDDLKYEKKNVYIIRAVKFLSLWYNY